jgi:ribosome-associated protein
MIEIGNGLAIREEELRFTASRSGGPGGQNVNKVSTRVTLWFDVAGSPSLTAEQRSLIRSRLATRVSKEGVLRVVSQQSRSQAANREAALERFAALLREALARPRPRSKGRVPEAARRGRIEEKRRRSRIKRGRSAKISWED